MGVNQWASWWPTPHVDLLVFVLASSSVIASEASTREKTVHEHNGKDGGCAWWMCIHIHRLFLCAASVFAFEPCFVLRLLLPLKQVLLRNIHTQTHTGGKGFARGFMERTQ
jgi:hypothetical protein